MVGQIFSKIVTVCFQEKIANVYILKKVNYQNDTTFYYYQVMCDERH